MNGKNGIAYPFAYIPPYIPIRAVGAEKRPDYLCFGCAQRMVKVKGDTGRAEHFRHLPDQAVRCLPDNSLHKMAQALIVQAFLTAIEKRTTYNCILEGYYGCCDDSTRVVDLALSGSGIALERSVIENTRSDLVIFKQSGEPRVIIEIVVTNDLSSSTRDKYLDQQIPVVKVMGLTFDTIDALQYEVQVTSWLNIDKSEHRACRERRERAEKEARERRQEARSLVKIRSTHAIHNLTPITHVGVDANLKEATRQVPLRWDTRNRLNRQARQLAQLGFRQSQSRPTLFSYDAGGRVVYADLDSTTVLKAWDCEGPALYSFRGPGCRECVLEEVQSQLTTHGVPWRRHFMDHQSHDHELG